MCQNRFCDLFYLPASWIQAQAVGTTVDATVSLVATE